ncbi:hypothetical protein LguiB_031194 [Lonicera macranthoides]
MIIFSHFSYKYVERMKADGIKCVSYSIEDGQDAMKRWNKVAVVYDLVGKVLWKWGKFGVVNLCLPKSDVFIVDFDDVEGSAKVMDTGLWSLCLLSGLKLDFWAVKMLSKIANVVGKPLYTDTMIAKRS